MNSRRLGALATLAEAAADARQRQLDAARADLERLEAQRRELGAYARRYEREGLERARARPTDSSALGHRRRFVTGLLARVEGLGEEILRGETRVRETRARHAAALAKGLALDALRARHVEIERVTAAREEQRRSEESWRAPGRRAKRGFA